MKRTPCRVRRGSSLLEVLAYVAIVGSMISTFAMVMHQLLRADVQGREAFDSSVQMDRLARDLLADVHAAKQALQLEAASPGDPELALDMRDDSRIYYAWQTPWLVRTRQRGDRIVEQDAYRLGSAIERQWNLEMEPPRVDLVLRRRTPGPQNGAELRRIEAYVGRDLPAAEHAEP